MIISLIGMPGVGKSYWLNQVGQYKLAYTIDLDEYIVLKEGVSIAEIFKQNGMSYFRMLEKKYFKEALGQAAQFEHTVIALGAGFPCFDDNMNELLRLTLVVHIEVDLPVLVSRIMKEQWKRPLFADCLDKNQVLKKMRELYEHRMPFYNKAHVNIQEDMLHIGTFADILQTIK